MRPPTSSASSAAGIARSSEASSWLTSMRSAWNTRFAGCPARRTAAGVAASMSATSCAEVVSGVRLAALDDARGIARSELLLAVLVEDAAQLRLVVLGEHARGGERGGVVHPHVERGVLRIGEAPLDAVELHRGDAEIEEHARYSPNGELFQHLLDAVVDGMDEVDAVRERRETLGREREGVAIAVETDVAKIGEPAQERLGVAAQPERGVDEDGARALEGGGEQLDRAIEEDGECAGWRVSWA